MTQSKTKTAFDAELVRELAGLLDQTGLTEIEYDAGGLRIRVARSPAPVQALPPAPAPATAAAASAASAPAPAPVEKIADHPGLLTSPMVGVVYTSPEPQAPPFVNIGDAVAAGATVLLIEAMKVFNPIKAHRSGRVTRVFVNNGAPVEYGEPLLVIE
jgi:acetyl-CoA carboxylase biotin carboxyl carrier protein